MSNNILTLSLRPDVTVLAVPVEMNAHGFAIIGNVTLAYDYNGYTKKSLLLPPGSYELIGLLRDMFGFHVKHLVKEIKTPNMTVFKDYTDSNIVKFNAKESLKSAITAAGGDPKQNWLIITKK